MARPKDGTSSKKGIRKIRTLDSFSNVRTGSPEQSAAALAVLNLELSTTSGRPRRNASKKASESIVEMVDPSVALADDDADFVPTNDAEEEQDDEVVIVKGEQDGNLEGTTAPQGQDSSKTLSSKSKVPKTKAKGAKRGRKPKKVPSVEADAKALTPTSKLDHKRRIIRGLKDLTSARDKIERIYGLNEQKLLGLAKVKEAFEGGPFDFDLQTIQKDSKYYVDFSPPCGKEDVTELITLQDPGFKVIQQSELQELFPYRETEIRLSIADLDTTIGTNQKIDFPVMPCGKRRGFVYNTGALVTDMAWLQREDVDDLYLAVAMSKHFGDPSDPKLRMFSKEEHISSVTIFHLEANALSFKKCQTLVHNFGEMWNLKWHNGYKSKDALGLLAACCQDGTVKFLKVDHSQDYEIKFLEDAHLEISLPQAHISCFDFVSSTKVVCGFQNGNVAEFELGSNVPSYYRKVHDSYIICIVTAYSDYEDVVINTVSVDGFICAFNPKSIQTTKCTLTRARGGNNTPAVYCPSLYCVVHSDGVNSVKAFPPRAVFATHQICLHENTVSSLAASSAHPFILSGSADGTLMINNVARRFLTGIKNNTSVYKYLKLWKWGYSSLEDKYRLDPNYEVHSFSVNDVSKARVNPHGINIPCVKWNETPKFGKFYAFVNSAGLLVIEELGASQ